MDLLELVKNAREAGLDLQAADGTLRIRGPRGLSGLMERNSARKEEVIAALSSIESPPAAAREFLSSLSADTDIRLENAGENERVSADVGASEPVADQRLTRGQPDSGERQGNQNVHSLCGSGFPPRTSPVPPPEIWADPIVLCPRCTSRRVLTELREMTEGKCWTCWEAEQRERS